MTPLRSSKAAMSIVFVVLTLVLSAPAASAALITSAASGPWTAPATWSGNAVPAASDDVIIAAGHTVTIAAAETIAINSIAIHGGVVPGANATLQIAGTTTVATSIAMTGGSPQSTGTGGSAVLDVSGTLNAPQIGLQGGSGSSFGQGGPASLTLTGSTAAVNVSSALTFDNGVYGNFAGGAASLSIGTTGTLDVRGYVANNGLIALGAGQLKLGGNYTGAGSFNPGTGTVTLDGTSYQYWDTPNTSFYDLRITNAFSDPANYSAAVDLYTTSTVAGTLYLQGGVLGVVGSLSVNSATAIQRTSGHVHGYLIIPVPVNQAVLFPLGTGAYYTPLTVTSPTAGSLKARPWDYGYPEAGPASLNVYWDIYSSDIPALSQIVFGYDPALVRGTESSYVAGRMEYYGAPWQRYSTSVSTSTHTATATGTIPPTGAWTVAEPWSVTTATTFSARISSGGSNPRVNTPFDLAIDAKDGSGNPAVFGSAMTFSVSVGASPAATGVLRDQWGSTAPLSMYTPENGSTAFLPFLLYDKAESISLVITDTTSPQRMTTPITLSVTVDPAASALVVSTTAPGGTGSLPHAIMTANAGGCTTSPCPISFNIPDALKSTDGTWKIVYPAAARESVASSVRTSNIGIRTSGGMPYVDVPVVIDATTQPGYAAAGRPVVEIDANDGYSGLEFWGSDSTVRGLAIYNASTGIYLGGSGGHKVEGCYIGMTSAGNVPSLQWMYEGIYVEGANNSIGGPSPQQRNVIGAANDGGIVLSSYASGTNVRGNYIGLDPSGATAVPNYEGIVVESTYGNIIGGILAGEGNLIAGNQDFGLLLTAPYYYPAAASAAEDDGTLSAMQAAGPPTQVFGNVFGQTATNTPLPNVYAAISVSGSGQNYSIIGGPTPGQPNTIGHGSGTGVEIWNGAAGVVVSGNVYGGTGMQIDLDADSAPLPNDQGDADVNGVECPTPPCVSGNNGQNTPVISSAKQVGSTLETVVSVDSSAVTTTQSIRVEVYKKDAAGAFLLGNACFDTNLVNNLTVFAPNAPTTAGSQVFATATTYAALGCQPSDGQGGNTIGDGTSEFSAPATVVACSAPVITITPSTPQMCAGGSVALSATVTGGTGTYSAYQWYLGTSPLSGANGLSYTATAAGTYALTVTDNSGCIGSASVTVTQNALPTTAITGPTAVCSGGSVTLDAGAGFSTYAWSNGASTQTITVSPTATTSYTVTVTNASGCSATSASHTVTVNPTPTVAITGPTSMCSGTSVTLDAGAGFSTYAWSNGATTQTITVSPTATTSYTVTVTNASGCSATSASHTVAVSATPTAAITGPTSMCSGGSVTLDAGSGFSSYLWSNGATSQTITVSPTATTSYTVTVNSGSCSATSPSHTVTVNPTPTVTITGPTSTCSTGSVTLDAGAGFSTYAWSNGATTQTITVSPTATTTYTVTATTSAGCSGSASHTVTAGTAVPVTVTGPTSTCAGNAVTLDAGSGYASYRWSTGETTRTIIVSPSTTTTYLVEATTAAGCTSTGSTTVTVTARPSTTISTDQRFNANTAGNTASVSSQAGASYLWEVLNGQITGGQGTNSVIFTAGSPGDLTIRVTVTVGDCSDTGSVTVPVSSPDADLSVRMSAPPEVRAGDAFNYTIDVRNDGPAAASDAVLSASLSGGATVTSATGVWPCTTTSTSITCRAATASAGTSGSIILVAKAPSTPGTLTGSASIGSASNDGNSSNNSATASTEVLGAQASCPTVAPTLESPADNATGLASPVAFKWSAVEGAASYEVWITVNNTPQMVGTSTTPSLTAAVPSGTLNWYVVVRGSNNCGSLTSASRRLTVVPANNCPTVAPQLTAPSAGSTTTSPVTFTWTSVPNAIGYRVLIRLNDEATLQDLGTTTTALTLTAPVPAGSIQAYVEATYSGCDPVRSATPVAFTVTKPDPCAQRQLAIPTSPANDATVNTSLVRFQWTAAAGAAGYRVWISLDGAADQMIGATEGETSLEVALSRGTVAWWVEALYDGCAATRSETRSFTIPPATDCGTALANPILPANGAVLPDSNVTFSWANVPSAVEYELWLSLGEGSATLFGSTDGATTSLTTAVPAGDMKWFVRARVDRCAARDSQSASFTHRPPASCTTNQRPILVFPSDGERLTSPMNLRWSTPQGATKFEILVDRGNGPTVVATSTRGSAENVSLPTGRVRWFARAYFGEGCTPLDSAEQSIQVLPQPAACSELSAPVISAPGEISSGVSFRIHWTPVAGATSYSLQVASRPDFANAAVVSVGWAEYQLSRENDTSDNAAVYVRARAIDSRCSQPSFGPYGPTSAIFILPVGSSQSGTLASESGLVESSIDLGPELAGQSFTATPNASWITVTPSTGVVAAGGTRLKVVSDTRGLPLGTTMAGVTVTIVSPAAGNVASQGTTTITTPVTVNLVTPVTPTAKSAPPPDALIIPAVAHADGINAKFQSDVRVTNTSAQLMKYLITFTPSGESIASGRQTTMSIEPGRTVALDDILKTWFGTGTTSTTGTLEIRPQTQAFAATSSAAVKGLANLATFASSRTFNLAANGSFGQHIPAIPFANFIGKAAGAGTNVLSLQQIAQSANFRTNLGLVEGSGNPASLLVSVFGKSGNKLTSFAVDLKGGEHTQLNSFLASRGITSLDDGRVEIAVTSGLGKVTAYASVLDNKTSDPLLVTPVALSDAGDRKWVVPGVADLDNGFANWQTDLRIFNADSEPVETTASFYSQRGGEPKTATFTLQPGEVRQLDRALSSLFSTTNDAGAIQFTTSKASRVVATARTYNLTQSGGTFGQFISAVTESDAASLGSRPLQLLQVEESDRFRSNLGLAEISGKPVKLSISVIPPDSKLTAFLNVELGPNEFRQIPSLLKTMGLSDTFNARVTVRVIEGSGRVTAYASVIDLATQDPTYIPAQ